MSDPADSATTECSVGELPGAVFRAYDIRGIVPDPLSPELVRAIGWSIAQEARGLGEARIAIGRDGRLTGPRLRDALVEGLLSGGVSVVDIGPVPTPILYFATRGIGSGIMLTGSHNPPAYNGLKIALAGETLFGPRIQRLRERLEAHGWPGKAVPGPPAGSGRDRGSVTSLDPREDYLREVVGRITRGRGLRVVIDAGNGITGPVAPGLVRALGHEVIELHCEVDGRFPNHPPDTSVAESYRDLGAAVVAERADLGLAFDGDGDRLGVVDGRGEIIWPDRFMMLYAEEILRRRPGAVFVHDVKCTRHLGEFIVARGGRAVMGQTGHSYIKKMLKESGAALAGEMSGHLFFSDRWYGFDDALYAAARLLEILGASAQSPTDRLAALPRGITTPEYRIEMHEGEPERFVTRLLDALPGAPGFAGARLETLDGVRAELADGWALIRASNTSPSLSLRLEADSEAALERIVGDLGALLIRLDPDLRLPFEESGASRPDSLHPGPVPASGREAGADEPVPAPPSPPSVR